MLEEDLAQAVGCQITNRGNQIERREPGKGVDFGRPLLVLGLLPEQFGLRVVEESIGDLPGRIQVQHFIGQRAVQRQIQAVRADHQSGTRIGGQFVQLLERGLPRALGDRPAKVLQSFERLGFRRRQHEGLLGRRIRGGGFVVDDDGLHLSGRRLVRRRERQTSHNTERRQKPEMARAAWSAGPLTTLRRLRQ